jgi:hypothetical protein
MSGCAVALALALLSYVRLSADGLTYRNPEIWSNEATLLLSDTSRSEWRRTLPPTVDPNRLPMLVDQYAELATGDAVVRALRKRGMLPRAADENGIAEITATAMASPINGAITPVLKITGMAATPVAATRLTLSATDTFIQIARAEQIRARIPPSQRVQLRIVRRAGEPKLVAPRSKTTFIIILLAGLTLTVAAAFIRDNLRRPADRKDDLDQAAVFDLEAQPVTSTSAEPVRAAENGTSQVTNEGGSPEVPSVLGTHRRARSSG